MLYIIVVFCTFAPKIQKRKMKQALHLITLCVTLALMAGCSGKATGEGKEKMSETARTALQYRTQASDYDFRLHQMRLAELYYRKAYETLKDNPSQAWDIYADAGYRCAYLLSQRGNMESALTVVSDVLKNEDLPVERKSPLLALMAWCQMTLGMSEAAKQNFAKAYEYQLMELGGKEKGDFNLAIVCNNIFLSFLKAEDYDEARTWLNRYEEEFRACERLGIVDSRIIAEHNGLIALYEAEYLRATGRTKESAAVYASIPKSHLADPMCIETAAIYLKDAGRFAEAADMYERLDTTYAATDSSTFTFDIISTSLAPRYEANRRAGRVAEALELADKTFATIDSALAWQKQNDAAELAVIYQTHEKELALEESQAKITIYRILAFSFFAIMIVIFVALWRMAIAYRRVLIKNRELFDLIQREQRREVRDIQRLVRQPEQERTPGEQIFLRLVELMAKEQPYTDAELNRDALATMLATNHRYIDEAIRECSDALSTNAFINGYRVDHAARLLTQTDEPIALIAEMSGFANRTTFNEQFRSRYKMTPSEYRTAAKT